MRRAAIACLAVALAVPATASAKEITKVTVCGTDGCVSTHDPAILQGLTNGGPPTVPPSSRGAAVRLRSTIAEGSTVLHRSTTWFLPASGLLVAEDGTWMRLPAAATSALVKLSAGLAFFPASKVGGVAASAAPPPAPPAPAPSDSGSGAWWLLAAVPLAAVGALLVARRRRPGDGGAPSGATP
jgi:hypothetical protein